MEFKELKLLTDTELGLYMKNLENEFEAKKAEINGLCNHLEKLDKEYAKAENEIRRRQILRK
jgi:hypothetical protein